MSKLEESKTLTRTIGEAGILLSASNFIGKLASLASAVLVIRYLSVYDYGLWQLILSALGIFAIFSFPGLESFLISDLSLELAHKNIGNYKALLKKFFKNILIVSLFAGILLYLLAPFVGTFTSRNLTLYLRILAFIFVINAVKRFYAATLYSNLKFFRLSLFKVSDSLFYLSLILLFVFYKKIDLTGVSLSYLGSSFLTCLFFSPLIFQEILKLDIGKKSQHDELFWQSIKKHGKWSLADDYFNDFLTNLRPWIIGFFLNAEALAVFSVAKNLYGHLTTVVPLDQIIKPIIPRQLTDKNKFSLFFSRSIKYSIWFSIILAIVAYIFSPYFIKIFFPQYLISLPLFNILLLALITSSASIVITQAYYALKAQKILFFSTFAKIISIAVFLPVLIILFKLKGIAIEFVILVFLLLFIRYYLLKRSAPEVHLDFTSFFRFDKLDRILLKKILVKFKMLKPEYL